MVYTCRVGVLWSTWGCACRTSRRGWSWLQSSWSSFRPHKAQLLPYKYSSLLLHYCVATALLLLYYCLLLFYYWFPWWRRQPCARFLFLICSAT